MMSKETMLTIARNKNSLYRASRMSMHFQLCTNARIAGIFHLARINAYIVVLIYILRLTREQMSTRKARGLSYVPTGIIIR